MAQRTSGRAGKKIFHKIGEVCDLTQTEPYVLRYWESEFPFLAPEKNRAGQRIYTDEDIQTVLAIKRLLYEEGYTTAGARRKLEQERRDGAGGAVPGPEAAAAGPPASDILAPSAARQAESALVPDAGAAGAAGEAETLQALRRLRQELLELKAVLDGARDE